MRIEYDLDIVGGAFDGAPHLKWLDDGRHPLPALILVGVCAKGMDCGTQACRRGAAHVSYWLPEEEGQPVGAQPYRKQEEFVVRDAADELSGRGVYAVGGLLEPRNFGARARTPADGGLVTALASDYVRGAYRDREFVERARQRRREYER